MGVTRKQKVFFDQLHRFVRQHGYFPSMRRMVK
jgi:hypothetical protein